MFWPLRVIFDGIATGEVPTTDGRRRELSHYFRRNFDGARMLTSSAEGAKSETTDERASQPVFLLGDLFLGTFLFLLRSVSVLSLSVWVVPRAVKIDDTVDC